MGKRNKMIILSTVTVIIAGIFILIFKNQEKNFNQTKTPIINNNTFFPLEIVKNTVINTINNISTSITDTIDTTSESSDIEPVTELLVQVVSKPVADYGFINYQGTSTLFYVEKETGHIFLIATSGPSVILSNTTIPKIQSMKISPNNPHQVFVSSLDRDGQLIYQQGVIDTRATSTELLLKPMVGQIKDILISPDGKQVFTLQTGSDGAIGLLSNINSSLSTTIFSSLFSEWLVDWSNNQYIIFNSKPSFNIAGSIYGLNKTTKEFKPLIISELSVLGKISPNNKSVIFSSIRDNKLNLVVKNIENNSELQLMGLETLVDKCIWNNDGVSVVCAVPKKLSTALYPDDWYKGLVLFNDNLWKINTIISDSDVYEFKDNIDAINLKITNNGDVIYFQNKIDQSLWQLDLSTAFES